MKTSQKIKKFSGFILFAVIFALFALFITAPPTLAQGSVPYIGCSSIVEDAAAGTVEVTIIVDSGAAELDTVRMEMNFDSAVLSNADISTGSDFDSDFGKGTQGALAVAIFGRSTNLGSATGEVNFATITFDWTGDPTDITFNPGQAPATEAGSLAYLVGAFSSLNGELCAIAGGAGGGQPTTVPTVAATDTPMSTVPSATDTPVSTVSAATDTPVPTVLSATNTPIPTTPPTGGEAMIFCSDVRTTATTAEIDIAVTSARLLDQVRMEMEFDTAALSNGEIEPSSDFDSDFGKGFQGNLAVAIFGRSTNLGATSGSDLSFATITFDWTGDTTQVIFNNGQAPATESGSLSYLVGAFSNLTGVACTIGDGVPPTVEPITPTATPLVPVATDTPSGPVATATPSGPVATATPSGPAPTSTPRPGLDPNVDHINCSAIRLDQSAGTMEIDVAVNAVMELDQVRMEMMFDTTNLTFITTTMGTDFNADFGVGAVNDLSVALLARTEDVGSTTGLLEFGTVQFDWTGEGTEVTLLSGQAPASETGSISYLKGEYISLEGVNCPMYTVYDLIEMSPDHTVLEEALIAAGFDTVLDNYDNNFTVFAPTDTALNELGLGAADLTSDVLLTHVLADVVEMSADITNGETFTSQSGNVLTANLTDGVIIEGLIPDQNAVVETPDLTAYNGVVHLVNFPIELLGGTINCSDVRIDETAGSVEIDITISALSPIDQARLEMIYDIDHLTFVTTTMGTDFNSSFGAGVVGDLSAALFARTEDIGTGTGDLAFGTVEFAWDGTPFTLDLVTGSDVTEAGSLVYRRGFYESLTATACGMSVYDRIMLSPDHTILETALIAAGLDEVLSDLSTNYTVFAPTDEALGNLDLTAADLTTDVLLSHVLSNVVEMSTDITNGETFTSESGNVLTADLTDGVMIDGLIPDQGTLVETPDITAANGVVHAVGFPIELLGGMINCSDLRFDEAAGTVEVDIMVDSLSEIDQVRMEMLYDVDALTFVTTTMGTDFNSSFGAGIEGNLSAALFARTEDIGTAVGDNLAFGTVVFDWNGNDTFALDLITGSGETEAGSLVYRKGFYAPLTGTMCGLSVYDRIELSPDHTMLEQALLTAGLDDDLDDLNSNYTVFAPTDDALRDIGLTPADLTEDVLLSHILSDVVETSLNIADGETFTSESGNVLTADLTGGITLDGILPSQLTVVETPDIMAENGVIHEVAFPIELLGGSIECSEVRFDEEGGTLEADILVNSLSEIDQVRMEMVYDVDALTFVTMTMGTGFNSSAGSGALGNLVAAQFGRTQDIGPGIGELQFGTVMFNWNDNWDGDSALIQMATGSNDVEAGSLVFRRTQFAPLTTACEYPLPTSINVSHVAVSSHSAFALSLIAVTVLSTIHLVTVVSKHKRQQGM